MKETGLMFKAPLVRAILSGQKTQTRRILKNQQSYDIDKCPLGQPGDRIYVRETFGHFERNEDFKQDCKCFYRADGDCVDLHPWRPAIHMPKWAARIWLEITGVRVERLQEITEADCIAEGATGGHGAIPNYDYSATPLEHFRHIWESTGADWAAKPWVWVIDFKQIAKEPA